MERRAARLGAAAVCVRRQIDFGRWRFRNTSGKNDDLQLVFLPPRRVHPNKPPPRSSTVAAGMGQVRTHAPQQRTCTGCIALFNHARSGQPIRNSTTDNRVVVHRLDRGYYKPCFGTRLCAGTACSSNIAVACISVVKRSPGGAECCAVRAWKPTGAITTRIRARMVRAFCCLEH